MASITRVFPATFSIVALGAGAALAQQTQSTPTVLDTVSSTATRTETPLRNVPGTVTVIDTEEIDRRNVQNTRDLIRYEPGVSVGNSPTRAGRGSYTIRGIGENRVLITVDGVRLPDFPANSQPGTFTRDYVDLENVKRVEIVRGPASALYGSDAIGGVVAYITKDPADYLSVFGKDWYVSGKSAFDSADTSFAETGTFAARIDKIEALALYTRRDGIEVQNNGSLSPNPQTYFSNNGLAKLVFHPTTVDQIRLTGEIVERNVKTDIRSELSATVLDSRGDDYTQRRRIGVDHTHSEPIGFIDKIQWQIAYQDVDRNEHSDQRRLTAGTQRLRVTDQDFEQQIAHVDLQLESKFAFVGLPNHLIYGLDANFTQTTRPRDRTETNLATGTSTKTIAGETFPTKSFPDTDTILAGAYIQDEITAFGGRLSVLPALRFDYYRMDPKPDAAFLANNPGVVSEVSATELSPKLGSIYRLTDIYSLYGQYAHGFRSPPYDDANIGFTNSAFGYRILPNPDLQPESSDGVEAGIRGAFPDGRSFSVGGFYTVYKNFIEQRAIGSSGGLLLFQSQNLSKVVIYGAEAKARWQFTETWSLNSAVGYARGTDEGTDLPVDSVDPLKAVVGLRYDDPKSWGSELVLTAVDRKDRVSNPTFFKASGYATVDLLGYWNLGKSFSLNAGIFNILDQKYWIAQDVVGVSATDPLLDLYTSPGRTFAINGVLRW